MYAKNTARIVQVEGDICELENNLEVLERCNGLADSRQSLQVDEYELLKHHVAGDVVHSGEMSQHLMNTWIDADVSIDRLNYI